jgi:tetratricopeptide (TPR) repeat protein
MTQEKNKNSKKPLTRPAFEMSTEKLMEYLGQQKFESIDEINQFLQEHVNGKKIDEIVPPKKGRKSKIELSDDLLLEAYESEPTEGIRLVDEALKLNPENVKALNYLAETSEKIEDANILYKRAMDIATKQLGEAYFEKNKGHFWVLSETRPYMTAKFNYAINLFIMNNVKESIKEFEELLKLNPNDNQGVRYKLSGVLLQSSKFDLFYKLYRQFESDSSIHWLYNYALFVFLTEGHSPKANQALRNAYIKNNHVLLILTGKEKLSTPEQFYSYDDKNEAQYYLLDNYKNWLENDGVIDWITMFLIKK